LFISGNLTWNRGYTYIPCNTELKCSALLIYQPNIIVSAREGKFLHERCSVMKICTFVCMSVLYYACDGYHMECGLTTQKGRIMLSGWYAKAV
jgi:hypothetical protein